MNDFAVEDSNSMATNQEITTNQENNSLSTHLDSVVSAPIMAKDATEIPADQPLYGLMGKLTGELMVVTPWYFFRFQIVKVRWKSMNNISSLDTEVYFHPLTRTATD